MFVFAVSHTSLLRDICACEAEGIQLRHPRCASNNTTSKYTDSDDPCKAHARYILHSTGRAT